MPRSFIDIRGRWASFGVIVLFDFLGFGLVLLLFWFGFFLLVRDGVFIKKEINPFT